MSALAEQQAALVRALVQGERVPDGFDAGRVAVAAASLARKRERHAHRPAPRRRWWFGRR